MPSASAAYGPVNINFNPQLPVAAGSGRISAITFTDNVAQNLGYTNGTGALQYDIYASKIYTLVTSTPQTIDLSAITDVAGTSQVPLRAREVLLMIPDTTLTHFVTVAAGASNGWAYAPAMIISPGGSWHRVVTDPTSVGAGVGAVIGSTSKTIKYDPGALNITLYAIYLFCSALT